MLCAVAVLVAAIASALFFLTKGRDRFDGVSNRFTP